MEKLPIKALLPCNKGRNRTFARHLNLNQSTISTSTGRTQATICLHDRFYVSTYLRNYRKNFLTSVHIKTKLSKVRGVTVMHEQYEGGLRKQKPPFLDQLTDKLVKNHNWTEGK